MGAFLLYTTMINIESILEGYFDRQLLYEADMQSQVNQAVAGIGDNTQLASQMLGNVKQIKSVGVTPAPPGNIPHTGGMRDNQFIKIYNSNGNLVTCHVDTLIKTLTNKIEGDKKDLEKELGKGTTPAGQQRYQDHYDNQDAEAALGQQQALEDAQREATDFKAPPKAMELMKEHAAKLFPKGIIVSKVKRTKDIDDLGNTITVKEKVDVPLSADEIIEKVHEACKQPKGAFKALLEHTRDDGAGFGAGADSEVFAAYGDLFDVASRIKEDSQGEYISHEDITPEQRAILKACRIRGKGIFIGWNKKGELDKALPILSDAINAMAQDKGGKLPGDLAKYGITASVTAEMGQRLKDVKIRKMDGTEEPLIPSTNAKAGTATNNLVGTSGENIWVGLTKLLNGKGFDEQSMGKEGILALHETFSKLDAANEALQDRDGFNETLMSEDDFASLELYQKLQDQFQVSNPTDLTKAFTLQRAHEFGQFLKQGGYRPIEARLPSSDEERGDDKQLGVKRDLVLAFNSDKEAKAFAKNIGLDERYTHGNEIDVSLKTLLSGFDGINFEGATWDVVHGKSTAKKVIQSNEMFDSITDRVKTTKIPGAPGVTGEELSNDMQKARDFDADLGEKLGQIFSSKNEKVMPAVTNLLKNIKTDSSLANAEVIKGLTDRIATLSDEGVSPAARTKTVVDLKRDLTGLVRTDKSQKDSKYLRGAALHDLLMTAGSKHAEAVVVVGQGKVTSFGSDRIMDDAIIAAANGQVTNDLYGWRFNNNQGDTLMNSTLVADARGFMRMRTIVEDHYAHSVSQTIEASAQGAAEKIQSQVETEHQ
jgi:hypothetical protein